MNSLSSAGLERIHRHWGLLLTLGIVLLVLGVVAFAYTFAASLISVMILGWLLVGSGLFQGLVAFQIQSWGGVFLHLVGGALEVIVGMLVVAAPAEAAPRLALVLAAYLLLGGLFRATTALMTGFPSAGWAALAGLASFFLGLALWRQWPASGLWFIGMCVGLDLLLHGSAWIVFALNARRSVFRDGHRKDSLTAKIDR